MSRRRGEDAFAALAKDLNVRVSLFDPGETGGTEALQPDYYLTLMRQNLKKSLPSRDNPHSHFADPAQISTIAFIAHPIELGF